MKIVVLDGYTLNPDGDNPWDEVAALGDLTVHEWTEPEQIVERALPADVVLTNKVPLTAETLARLPNLKLIDVLATGYDVVDGAAARARGIPVSNVPEYGTDAVAQFVFALLLALCHKVELHDRTVREGEWASSVYNSYWKTPQLELAGRVMAVVGFGRIGRRVGELAHAFGMEVLAVDPFAAAPPAWGPFAFVPVAEAFRRADVVSLNCALTTENRGMVNRALLASMKRSAFLINAARGPLVDEAALAAALDSGVIAGAALDVVSSEPIRPDNPLLAARNCLLTPHMAWSAVAARRRLMRTAAANIAAFLAGRPENVVN